MIVKYVSASWNWDWSYQALEGHFIAIIDEGITGRRSQN
jgi:hypothetical protein